MLCNIQVYNMPSLFVGRVAVWSNMSRQSETEPLAFQNLNALRHWPCSLLFDASEQIHEQRLFSLRPESLPAHNERLDRVDQTPVMPWLLRLVVHQATDGADQVGSTL